jgi:hypothetical protein
MENGKLRCRILDPKQGAVLVDVCASGYAGRGPGGDPIRVADRMTRLGADEMDLAGAVTPDRDITVRPRL